MRTNGERSRPLEQALEGVKPDKLKGEVKKRWTRLARSIDALGRIDNQSGEVFVDEASLRTLLRDVVPRDFEDRCVEQLRNLPGSKLRNFEGADKGTRENMKRIQWQALAKQVGIFEEEPPATYKVGLNNANNLEDVRKVVNQWKSDMPDVLLDPEETKRQIEGIIAQTREAREGADASPSEAVTTRALPSVDAVYRCLIGRIGWWAAVALLAVIAAALVAINLATGGLLTVATAWVVFWVLSALGLAGSTLWWVGNCIRDPWS
jgi:hypothetical protein